MDRNASVTYVALGDSTVEGIGATSPARTYVGRLSERLRGVYPSARAVNLGRGGAVSADVVRTQLPRAVELKPDLVTLSVGPNDITGGVDIAVFERNLRLVFKTLVHDTRAVIVTNLLPDLAITPRFRRSSEHDAVERATVAFNEALAREARRHGVATVDLYTASRAEVPKRPELIASDGYHPSDLGYAVWAELVWRVVADRIPA